jgi:PhnB protein
MAERSLVERLDEVVDTIVARPEAARVPADRTLAALWRVAVDLRDRPSESFRVRLKIELERRAETMKQAATAVPYMRAGFRSITPYVVVQGADRLIDFARQAFGAEEVLRVNRPDGAILHAEIRIGDSMVELADPPPGEEAQPASLHLYVEDADAVYARAMQAGATSLIAPMDMPYGDREGDVRDPFGNNWYIATYQEGGPIRPGLHTVTPYLHVRGAERVIDFLQSALGAQQVERDHKPDGTVAHAKFKLGDSIVELGEAHGEFPPMVTVLHYYVPDTDALYARAVGAGGTPVRPPADTPYGDRMAVVGDPAGNQWCLATHIKDVHP